MNYSLLEYYETAYEKVSAFKQDRYLYNYLKQVIFAKNTKISFGYDESFTISVENDDEYVGIEIAGNDILLKCIKSVNGDPMSLSSSEVRLINGQLYYSGEFMTRQRIDYRTTATIVTDNGVKKLKTTIYNASRKKKNSTTLITVGDSYVTNRLANQFTLLKDKSSVAQSVINELMQTQSNMELNSSEIEHKIEAVEKMKVFDDNGFVSGRSFDIVLLANQDESQGDHLKLSYRADGKLVGVDVTDSRQALYCELDGKKSVFACEDGKYIAETISSKGQHEIGQVIQQDNHKYVIVRDDNNIKSKIEYPLDEKDDLLLMTVFSYVGRNAVGDINSTLYSMTSNEPIMY